MLLTFTWDGSPRVMGNGGTDRNMMTKFLMTTNSLFSLKMPINLSNHLHPHVQPETLTGAPEPVGVSQGVIKDVSPLYLHRGTCQSLMRAQIARAAAAAAAAAAA